MSPSSCASVSSLDPTVILPLPEPDGELFTMPFCFRKSPATFSAVSLSTSTLALSSVMDAVSSASVSCFRSSWSVGYFERLAVLMVGAGVYAPNAFLSSSSTFRSFLAMSPAVEYTMPTSH